MRGLSLDVPKQPIETAGSRYSYIISYDILLFLNGRTVSKVGTDKPTLKVKMQSVSDDDVRKDFLKSHVLSN